MYKRQVVTRDIALAAGVPGGLTTLYPVLKAMEDAGDLARGMFVEGMGPAQFAQRETVEALRAYYQDQLYTSNLNTAVMDDLLENSTFKSIPQQVMDYQVNQCLNYYSTLAGYYGYDLDGLVQNLLGYENTDDMLAHLESSLEDYSKEALLYQAVAESLDITPTQEQLDAYSDYKDTYGQNYCTMVALMDAVTSTLTSGAVVS